MDKTEKERILKMLEQGTINSEEAYRLLESMGGRKRQSGSRVFRLNVVSDQNEKVNIRVPLGLAKTLLKVGKGVVSKISPKARKKMEEYNIDIDEILQSVDGEMGEDPIKLIDVEDGEDKVKIWIE